MNKHFRLAQKSTIIGASLAVFSIICIIIFSVVYYFEKELVFSDENNFILILVGIVFILSFLFTIYFSVLINHILNKLNNHQKKIDMIYNIVEDYKSNFESIDMDIAEVENNLVLIIREIQISIMELKNKIGVEKCSEIETPIEAENGYSEIH